MVLFFGEKQKYNYHLVKAKEDEAKERDGEWAIDVNEMFNFKYFLTMIHNRT